MKKILLLLFLVPSFVYSQNIFEKFWDFEYSLNITDAVIDEDGNAYFTCIGTNLDVDSTLSIVVKTNSDFEIQWANQYRSLRRDDVVSLELLNDGNILIGGTMRQSFALDEGGSLIKINPDGEVIWHKVISGAFDERIIYTAEQANGDIVSIVRYGVNNQPSSITILEQNGNLISVERLFDSDNTGLQIEDAVQGGNGRFYMCGERFDSEVGRDLPFIASFALADTSWMRTYDLGEDARPSSISINEDHEIVISGLRDDPESVFNSVNTWFIKVDSFGDVLQSKRIFRENNGFSEFPSGVHLKNDGSVLVSSNFLVDNGFYPVISSFDPDGVLVWAESADNELGTSLSLNAVLADDLILVMGRTFLGLGVVNVVSSLGQFACNDFDTPFDVEDLEVVSFEDEFTFSSISTNAVELDLEVIPLSMVESENCSGTLSSEDEEISLIFELYPNPSQDFVYLDNLLGAQLLQVYSIDGRLIEDYTLVSGVNKLLIDHLPSGSLIISLKSDFGVVTQRMVKL
ncbi:MAG: T9SS type A sorting domain-containing protein [Bacteroidota bacterium]